MRAVALHGLGQIAFDFERDAAAMAAAFVSGYGILLGFYARIGSSPGDSRGNTIVRSDRPKTRVVHLANCPPSTLDHDPV
jgi:hypothetical protein